MITMKRVPHIDGLSVEEAHKGGALNAVAGIAGIVAAPFTGGASLALTAGALASENARQTGKAQVAASNEAAAAQTAAANNAAAQQAQAAEAARQQQAAIAAEEERARAAELAEAKRQAAIQEAAAKRQTEITAAQSKRETAKSTSRRQRGGSLLTGGESGVTKQTASATTDGAASLATTLGGN